MRKLRRTLPFWLIALAGVSRPGAALAEEVVAVLSSDLPYYSEALEGFKSVYGSVPVLKASGDLKIPKDVKVVAAFGRKAATLPYPRGVALVYGMAPGTEIRDGDFRSITWVSLIPESNALLKRAKEIQPELRKLAVLWMADSFGFHVRNLTDAGKKLGVEIISVKLNSRDELPDRLRSIDKNADAFLLLADPLLISEETLAAMKDFSWSNRLPFYVTTGALIERGATAAIAASFAEVGRMMGRAAKSALQGSNSSGILQSDQVETVINPRATAAVGLAVPPAALKTSETWQP